LKIFHDVAKALTSTLDLDTILHTIMEKMSAYFEPATWALVMIDESSREPYYAASVGKGAEGLADLRLSTGDSLIAWVIKNGQALVIENVNADPRSELLLQTLADYAAIAIENARAVGRIQELSITDDCTGLYNARHLFTMIAEELHRSARFGYEFTLLFLDLDHFKRVNDQYGHIIGSKLLAEVGECLRESLRLVDAAFRYGGDEFAILLPQTSGEAGLRVTRRIAKVLRHRRWLPEEGIQVELRASIGVSVYPTDGDTPQLIVQRADDMMYAVKQAGRDNIAISGLGVVGLEEDRTAE
jgi:diguanylate cyclase (GGDEF)-like protein